MTTQNNEAQPRLVDAVRDLLQRYRVMRVMEMEGDGTVTGPASFRVFGAGPANRQLILDVFLRLLMATQDWPDSMRIHCSRTYRLKPAEGSMPSKLVQGYTIAGSIRNNDDASRIFEALDLSVYESASDQVDTAFFYVNDGQGNAVLSGPRNVPQSGAGTPDGERGMRGAYSSSSGG